MESNLLLLSQIGFVLLSVVYIGLLVKELRSGIQRTRWDHKRKKKFIVSTISAVILWGLFVSIWSGSGMMSDFRMFPFNFLPVLALPLITMIVIACSKTLGEILANVPPENIARLQSFRFFVELLLWALFIAGSVPVQMTFEGRNLDILSGITAPVVAWLVSRKKVSKAGLIIWNLACLALLVNIVTVAILSTPSPWRVFMDEPANTIVTRLPVSWLPGFLVPLAYTLHFFSLRQLLTKRSVSSPALKEA